MAVVKVTRKGNSTAKLLKALRDLDNSSVEIGHFEQQGLHSDSGMTYPELMAGHHFGIFDDQPPKSPLMAFTQLELPKIRNTVDWKAIFNKWSKNVLKANSSDELLNDVGRLLREDYKAIFGIVGPYMPPDATGTPMYETGELLAAAAYRTSKDNIIKES